MPVHLSRSSAYDPQFLLWVSPVDDRRMPVDQVFIDAADSIGRDFLCYRERELNDESRARVLAERAVHLCSRANKRRPVDDPVAYLFRTFRNLVDRELGRLGRLLPWLDEFLYVEGRSGQEDLERKIEWREILELVDQPTRAILNRMFIGLTVNEIAKEMGISPDTVSQRLSRARKKLRKALDPGRSRGRRSRVDGTRKRRRRAQ